MIEKCCSRYNYSKHDIQHTYIYTYIHIGPEQISNNVKMVKYMYMYIHIILFVFCFKYKKSRLRGQRTAGLLLHPTSLWLCLPIKKHPTVYLWYRHMKLVYLHHRQHWLYLENHEPFYLLPYANCIA